MRNLFGQSTGDGLIYLDFPNAGGTVERKSSGRHDPRPSGSFVKLEIHVEALHRLIVQHRLHIEEIHCLGLQSKNVIRAALIDSLVTPSTAAADFDAD